MYVVGKNPTFYIQFQTYSGEQDDPEKKGRNNCDLLLDPLLKNHIRNSQANGKGKGKTGKRTGTAPGTTRP